MKSFYEQYGVSPLGLILCLDQSDPRSYGNLQYWKDMSSLRHHAYQATAGNQPVISGDSGIAGTVRTYDGVSEYMEVNLGALTNLSGSEDFTVAIWTKFSGNQRYVISQSHIISPYSSDWFFLCFDSNNIFWFRSVKLGNYNSINDGEWHYLVMTWDKTAETYEGFVDGMSIGTSAVVSDYGGVGSIKIGANGEVTDFFNGSIALVQIFSRRFSVGEAQKSYNAIRKRFSK